MFCPECKSKYQEGALENYSAEDSEGLEKT